MAETTIVSTDIATSPAAADVEPAIIAELRRVLGARRPPGAHPGRRRAGEPDVRAFRLDLLADALTPETLTAAVMWLESERRASPATRRAYADDLLSWADWYAQERGGRLDLAALTRADVTLWLAHSRAAGHRPATIARRIAALSSLYRYAASQGLPLVCPITEDHRPRVQKDQQDDRSAASQALDPAELRRLTSAAADVRDALVIALITTTGLRVSELCAADDSDVTAKDGRMWLHVQRKGGRGARVNLDPAVMSLLDRYRAERPAPDGEGAPLIRDGAGRRVDRHDIIRLLRRVARAAGIGKRVTPHVLRASAVTRLVDDGKDVIDVQRWAGHADVSTTMIYVGAQKVDARNAALTADLATLVQLPSWLQPSEQGA